MRGWIRWSLPERKRPILFRFSGGIFIARSSANRLAESYIKEFLRNREYMAIYLQFIGLTSAALLLIEPILPKMIVFAAAYFFLKAGIKGYVQKIASEPFARMFPPCLEGGAAAILSEKTLMRPALIITFFSAWFTTFGSWAMIAIVISIAIHIFSVRRK